LPMNRGINKYWLPLPWGECWGEILCKTVGLDV
jgi:hypothetical protein